MHAKLGNPISLLALNLLVAGMLVLAFKNLPDYRFLPCTYTFIQPFLFALAGTLGLNVLLDLFLRGQARMSILVLGALLLVSLYFGSYNYSPLRFLNRENPILRGFLVSPQGRVEEVVASGDIITLSMGVPAAISIESDLHDVSCRWSSRNGGAWDDPSSCDTTYIPPAADYDILSVRIMPGCRLAPIRGQLKISILP